MFVKSHWYFVFCWLEVPYFWWQLFFGDFLEVTELWIGHH